MTKYIDYLFTDNESGEDFLVEIKKTDDKSYTDCWNEAWKIAEENFDDPEFIEKVDPVTAEILGLDTY